MKKTKKQPAKKQLNKRPKTKRPKVYAFLDSQNLNLGASKNLYNKNKRKIYSGWKLDFQKFRIYLKHKFRVSKAFLFIGYIEDNKKLYKKLEKFGYQLVFKPTIKDNLGKPKGNVDAELVLYSAAIEYNHFDKAVFVSGDGDFHCLYEYLQKKKKLLKIIIPNRKTCSTLLQPFDKFKKYLEDDKSKLQKKEGGVHSSNT
ncbi:NYN domain-containing protein [Patescibacteria group bacterium]|nr:NYN domain-containing protein [Patescibacteria group bacterium]